MSHEDGEPLVEYGLARFVNKQAVIEEPLALVSIMRYLEKQGLTVGGNIWSRFQADKGTAFEELVLLAVTKLLQDGMRLNDVFQFHSSTPDWAYRTAQVVARNSGGSFERFDIISGQPWSPPHGIAFHAKRRKDVKQWLESGQNGWCLPGTFMGPDLMVRLRLSDTKVVLLAIQAKCHFTGNKETVAANVTADAIQSLIPHNFFASQVRRQLSTPSPRQISELFLADTAHYEGRHKKPDTRRNR